MKTTQQNRLSSSKNVVKMQRGDHLITPRTGYTHHGLYIGNEQVIHYSGMGNELSHGEITVVSLEEFSNEHDVFIKEHHVRRYDREESVERAFSRLGEDWYNVLVNNCEHFVTWCIEGFHSSAQVNQTIACITVASNLLKSTTSKEIAKAVVNTATNWQSSRQITAIAPYVVDSLGLKAAGAASGIVAAGGLASSTGAAGSVAAGLMATPVAPVVAAVAGVFVVIKMASLFWDD